MPRNAIGPLLMLPAITFAIPTDIYLDRFTDAARDEVDMDKLAAALLGVAEESMQPEYISLILRSPQERLNG